jgi:hypothetical protein
MLKIFLFTLLSLNLCFALTKKANVKDCHEKAKGPCYEFKGRARVYGKGITRIWKVGTRRMYQVVSQTEDAYNDLNHLSYSTQMFADFDVCLLKPETPTGYLDSCIQGVRNSKTQAMPE